MRKNRFMKFRILFLLLALMLVLCGCEGKNTTEENNEAEEEKQITIGLCFDSFIIERWEKDRDVFVSTCRSLGAQVNVQNANGEVKEQIAQIEYLIEKNVDAIVIIAIDADSLKDVVRKAQSKGILVVAYDRMINNSNVDLYVSFDNESVGTMMGEAIAESLSADGKVVMMQGSPTDPNVASVYRGFFRVMSTECIEVLDSMNANGWRAEEAADYLYAHPELLEEADAIMCGNDNIATAVVRVLAENRKAGTTLVVGQDADLEACQRIVEGTQLMTVYKPVEKEAEAAATATVALLKGEKPEELVNVSDGTYGIPSIVLTPIAVTMENMDEVIIDSGFHLKDEVYMNVSK